MEINKQKEEEIKRGISLPNLFPHLTKSKESY